MLMEVEKDKDWAAAVVPVAEGEVRGVECPYYPRTGLVPRPPLAGVE